MALMYFILEDWRLDGRIDMVVMYANFETEGKVYILLGPTL